ncbi:WbuC family cupin fold metalloprotein [Prevotella denticola]|uniref:WbuC family cupin fold metalloprotein n=1 Tax=Prevotella denticola TaxID=28129 RepID=UPI0028E3654B|nr:WbuC family cupin fold metalloprotein [Prevotella denticola]
MSSPCQSLLNVLESGTIVPIHRHTHTVETYILLRGKFRMFFIMITRILLKKKFLM